jgi:hypothetical protein
MSSKTEPSCIHYKHSKVLLAIYGRMNAKNQFNITEITYSPQNVTPLYQEQIIVNPSLGKSN